MALADAVQNARLDAQAMASAAGGTLGKLTEMKNHFEDNPTFRNRERIQAMSISAGRVYPKSITPDNCRVTVTLLARYTFIGVETEDAVE